MINPEEDKYTEKLLDKILSALHDAVIIHDAHLRIIYANRLYAESTGLKQADIIGKTLKEIGQPLEIYEAVDAQVREVIATGKSLTFEADTPANHGVRRFEYIMEPLFNEDGSVASVVTTVRDVTEKLLALDELDDMKESRRQVIDTLESITDGFIGLDKAWRVTYINKRAQELLGIGGIEVLFQSLWGKLPNMQMLRLQKELHSAAETKTANSFEEFISPLSKWLEFHIYPYERGATVYVSDITERKRAEEMLRHSESRYRMLFDNAPISLWEEDASEAKALLDQLKSHGVTDYGAYFEQHPEALVGLLDTLKVIDVNKATLDLFEAGSKEELVRNLPQTFTEEAFIHVGVSLAAFVEGLKGFKLETTNRTLKGNIIHISLRSIIPPGYEETLARIFFAMDDVTDRKRIEMELAKEKDLSDALNDINASITSVLDFDEIMHRVVAESSRAMGSETTLIFLREDDYWEGRYVFGLPQGLAGLRFTDEEARTWARFSATGELLVVDDALNDERINPELAEQYNVRSFLSVPLITRGILVGVLFFGYRSTPVSFTRAQIDFAAKLAAAISVAIDNTRLFGDLKISMEESSKKGRDLQILIDISLDIVSGLKLDELMYKIAKYATELLGADVGAVGLINDETRTISYPFIFNTPEALIIAKVPSAEAFIKLEVPVGRGLSGRVIAQKRPMILEDYQLFPGRDPRFIKAGLRSMIMVPLSSRGIIIGTIAASHLSPNKKFNEQDIVILEGLGRHAAIALQNAKLYEAERHIADTLQESLLVLPKQIAGIEFGYLYRSGTEAAKVGGDFYDLFEIEHKKVGIVIGDVSGKGIEAAALTSVVKNSLKAHAFEDGTPEQVLGKVNDMMVRVSAPSGFITTFFGVLDIDTGGLIYCSAGHPPQLIKQDAEGVKLLTNNSPIIGAFAGLRYTSGKEILGKGDRLILYTDGITEARCDSDFFGEERLKIFIQDLRPIPTEEIPLAVFDHVMSWTGGKLSDDVALFAVSIESE